jgi:MOSC domain-containing protein YiiM
MTHQEIQNGLIELGFTTGWVITGEEITLWDNPEVQPSIAEIKAAAASYQATQDAIAAQKAEAKTALLERLGITVEEAQLLLS